ncbi:MAG: propionyl-coenzyme A carboxylase alpha polypeptide [Mesorhizobium sp.]|nr:MAG: propionyl-coenzyme A carboxylase alpha polypeptide [Mesorhizobium sp.]RWM39423.1 MAG: propionyl-coenzyme A carboxylase alpha polypeptide [Mesorhizobium sp.]
MPAISPARGEIDLSFRLSPIANVVWLSLRQKLPISPLEGEMPGRAEGGVTECKFRL